MNPPSTGKEIPLIIELRSLSKNTTASTTSSTSAKENSLDKDMILTLKYAFLIKFYFIF